VTWSWELDHPTLHPAGDIEILKAIKWSKCDAEEVDRLTAFWLANGYWNERDPTRPSAATRDNDRRG